jgi:hypothetical protein
MIGSMKLRGQDIFLTVMLAVLIFLAHDISEQLLILAVAVLQLAESRLPFLTTRTGRTASVVLQLAIIWVLIGYSGGVESHYYLLMLFPLVSTATFSGIGGTLAASFVGVGAYLSFLLYVDYNQREIPPEARHILAIRCLMMVATAITVNSLAAVIRRQSIQYKETAEQLAAANKNLMEAEAAMRRSD